MQREMMSHAANNVAQTLSTYTPKMQSLTLIPESRTTSAITGAKNENRICAVMKPVHVGYSSG